MLIILFSAVFTLVGITLLIIGSKRDEAITFGIGITLTLVIGAVLIATSVGAAIVQISKDVDFQNAIYEKKTIEYRLEHQDDNLVGNEMLYNDVVEFNNYLRFQKYWASNPWTNWFNNDKVAQLGYIEYEFAED